MDSGIYSVVYFICTDGSHTKISKQFNDDVCVSYVASTVVIGSSVVGWSAGGDHCIIFLEYRNDSI